jgi:hypothetical protein
LIFEEHGVALHSQEYPESSSSFTVCRTNHSVDTAPYLGVTLDKRLTSSAHIDQVWKKVFQRLGELGSLLNRRSGLSIQNGTLLYRQLIRPMPRLEVGCMKPR